jgi:hypothetical protein
MTVLRTPLGPIWHLKMLAPNQLGEIDCSTPDSMPSCVFYSVTPVGHEIYSTRSRCGILLNRIESRQRHPLPKDTGPVTHYRTIEEAVTA